MVMHARKHPRLDDGYTEKREAHPVQTSQYPSRNYNYPGSHGDRYNRKRSPNSHSQSPSYRGSPRYINKTSYTDRAKERHDRDTAMQSGTGGSAKKVNYTGVHPGTSNHSNNGHHSSSTDSRPANRSIVNSKEERKERDVQKSALQTCGDWSEHISSNGKRYYYNIKTELSQWEKPKEWIDTPGRKPDRHSVDSHVGNDRLHGSKESRNRHSSGPEKREKHLDDVRHMVQDSNSKPDKQYLFDKLQASQSKLQAELAASRSLHSASDHQQSELVYRRNDSVASSSLDYSSSSSRRYRRDSEGARPIVRPRHDRRHDGDGYNDDMDISPGSTPTSSRPSSCAGTPHIGAGSTPVTINPNSLSTSVGNQPSSSSSAPGLNIASIPTLINQLSGGRNNQELTQKALQTLQTLQEVLSRQIAAHQSSVASQSGGQTHPIGVMTASPRLVPEDPMSSTHPPHLPVPQNQTHSQQRSPYVGNALPQFQTSPQLNSHPQPQVSSCTVSSSSHSTSIPISQVPNSNVINTVYGKLAGAQNRTPTPDTIHNMIDDDRGQESPASCYGGSGRSSCGSPAPSETSSRGAELDPEMLSAAANVQKETSTMSTLSQYYNENLVGHVTGWQAEHAERQARRYWEESLSVGSLMCSQVSVELKQARSAVRVKEIHATLREQRNLFLEQQVQELEPVSSFLSSS